MTTRQKTIRYCLAGATRVTKADQDFDSVQVFDGTATWTDETTDAASSATGDVPLHTASGSAIYFGDADKFFGWKTTYSVTPDGGTVVLEYWNGSAWTALSSTTDFITDNETAYFSMQCKALGDWATTTVNGVSGLYWMRLRCTSAKSTAGTLSYVRCIKRRLISKSVELDSATGRTFRGVWAYIYGSSVVGGEEADVAFEVTCKVGSSSTQTLYARDKTRPSWEAVKIKGGSEQSGALLVVDLTALFTSDFTGTTHTVEVGFGDLVINQAIADAYWYSAELFATYDYDDTQATPIKSVTIPFEGEVESLTTSLQVIDSITKLTGSGGFIEEASPTIKSAYFEFCNARYEDSTTDATLYFALNSESETGFAFDMANQSVNGDQFFLLWDRTADIPTGVAIDLKARVSDDTALRPRRQSALLHVTYTYDNATTTRCNQSVMFPITRGEMSGRSETTTTGLSVSQAFYIVEKSPTLKESAISFHTARDGTSVGIGSSETTYARPIAADGAPLLLRFDSGASVVSGHGFTLSSGKNTLTIRTRASSYAWATMESSVEAYVILNYAFDKSSPAKSSFARMETHNSLLLNGGYPGFPDDFVSDLVAQNSGRNLFLKSAAFFNVPESSYFINTLGYMTFACGAGGSQHMALSVSVHDNSTYAMIKSRSAWPITAYDGGYGATWLRIMQNVSLESRLSTDDPTPGFDLETVRAFIFQPYGSTFGYEASGSFPYTAYAWWGDRPYTVTGTIVGYSGDGSGITVELHSEQHGGRTVATTTSTAGGLYTFKWHDNTSNDLWTEAVQDGTRLGRSNLFTAG